MRTTMMSEASEGGGSRRSAGDGDQRTAGAHRNDTIDLTVVCVSAAHLGLRGSECVGGVVGWYKWIRRQESSLARASLSTFWAWRSAGQPRIDLSKTWNDLPPFPNILIIIRKTMSGRPGCRSRRRLGWLPLFVIATVLCFLRGAEAYKVPISDSDELRQSVSSVLVLVSAGALG